MQVRSKNIFKMDYSQEDLHMLLDDYFDEIINVIDWGKFDALAHLTYPLRFIRKRLNKQMYLEPYSEKIDIILKKLAKNNKALEINTLGLENNEWQSDLYKGLLFKFFEFGGKHVTIGSDAHECGNIGHGIKDGIKLIEECGFEHITVFKNRKPILMKIK